MLTFALTLTKDRFVSSVTETTVLYSESGNSVTLRCSSAECPSSIEGFSGMYLNKKFMELEEVLYRSFKHGRPNSVALQEPFKNRIQVDGTLQDQNITISNLSVHDSDFYSCVFASFPDRKVRCNTYLLAVKGSYFFHTAYKLQRRVSAYLLTFIHVICSLINGFYIGNNLLCCIQIYYYKCIINSSYRVAGKSRRTLQDYLDFCINWP